MENMQAFAHALPVSSQKRVASGQPRICMTEKPHEGTPSQSTGTPSQSTGKQPSSSKPIKTVRSSASWANVFLPEFGRKGPGSIPDWDLRPVSLRSKEEGKSCDSCKGTGVMTCTFCSGLTHVCADGSVKPCPACNGKTQVTCCNCFGTTKQIEMVSALLL